MKPTVSLTFDDGLRGQLENAIPVMDRWGISGTFFLATACDEYPVLFSDWKDVYNTGHEIGSHSASHRKAASLSPIDMIHETQESKAALHMFGNVNSFCYPFTDAPGTLQKYVGDYYTQARGGRVARPDKYLVPGDGANLLNVTCFHVGPETIVDAPLWAAEVVRRKAWLTLMFHGVGEPGAWDNISTKQFQILLDVFMREGVEFATFAQGAAAYRGK